MKIIKKDGRIEEFRVNKIKNTVSKASDDVEQPLTEGDLTSLCRSIESKLKSMNRDLTSSYEVFGLIIIILKQEGFNKIADGYCKGAY
ncbi:ATP cone domain-containing protein [Clostridium sp. UBA6640]|uniref:ATP cone domain-containing protein n=1 Tax=Clostridium sp. UBA6640 TaxID=1946370 RepID=UPI0025C3928B|nr:ATP cone domain-containing protein [Clostridium sp. UBA6640]